SFASARFGHRGVVSVGASGAIFGAVGALIVILVVRRRALPESWRRSLLYNLLALVALELVIDWRVPLIDNAAHLGGLAGGVLLGLLYAPGSLLASGWPRRIGVVLGLALS